MAKAVVKDSSGKKKSEWNKSRDLEEGSVIETRVDYE